MTHYPRYKVVPVVPDTKMRLAGGHACPQGSDAAHYIWNRMMDASPVLDLDTLIRQLQQQVAAGESKVQQLEQDNQALRDKLNALSEPMRR